MGRVGVAALGGPAIRRRRARDPRHRLRDRPEPGARVRTDPRHRRRASRECHAVHGATIQRRGARRHQPRPDPRLLPRTRASPRDHEPGARRPDDRGRPLTVHRRGTREPRGGDEVLGPAGCGAARGMGSTGTAEELSLGCRQRGSWIRRTRPTASSRAAPLRPSSRSPRAGARPPCPPNRRRGRWRR